MALAMLYGTLKPLIPRASVIDFALNRNRYKYAALHLLSCASLSGGVETFGGLESRDAYLARLRREHSRKNSFWSLLTKGQASGAHNTDDQLQ